MIPIRTWFSGGGKADATYETSGAGSRTLLMLAAANGQESVADLLLTLSVTIRASRQGVAVLWRWRGGRSGSESSAARFSAPSKTLWWRALLQLHRRAE